ncbi:MAG TPA: HEAT repeat domain-containing protein [Polyangia bacterium]|jgi:hypothetical protein
MSRELDDRDPPRERLIELLGSADAATVHAAVLHVDRRLRRGEAIGRWEELLPGDVTRLPLESQLTLAASSADGLGPAPPDPPAALPPRVRLAWLRAWLLHRPDTLPAWEGAPLGREAVRDLPCERVIATGLLEALAASGDPSFRLASIGYLRAAAERGLLELASAQAQTFRLTDDADVPVAAAAFALLREPWTFALPLPRAPALPADLQLQREMVEMLRARREAGWIRRLLAGDAVAPAVAGGLLVALGESGAAGDLPAILERMQADPIRFGAAGLTALVALKRRGISAGDDEALALLALFLEGPALDATAAAEVLSGRADLVAGALEGPLDATDPAPPWPRITALLESFGTVRALARLRAVVNRPGERAGWWYAIDALGRLAATDAEGDILARFDDEPDACLAALRLIGGAATARMLGQRLGGAGAPPPWLKAGARLAFELDPSPHLFEQLAARGVLTPDILGALPAHGAIAQTAALRESALRPGHPLRGAAIQALGRAGGPLAADVLALVAGDPDELIRAEALAALAVLGRRLRESGAARPAHLLDGTADAGAALIADALLRRLRARALAPEIAARLLDALAGRSHPQLVPIVRPYLRHRSPAIRKRALACLGAAGPAAAAWIAPSLEDDDITVARQALLALGKIRGSGLAAAIAAWLDQSNMNLKKTAAETLVTAGDRTVAGKVLHWLAIHDNPGFRQDLAAALAAILGSGFRGVVIDRLAQTDDPRAQELLIEALSAKQTAAEIAALVRLRGPAADATPGHWTHVLVSHAYSGRIAITGGTASDLESELARRGITIAVPALPADRKDTRLWRFHAARAGLELARALRRLPVDVGGLGQHLGVLRKANVAGQMSLPVLSRAELDALFDAYRDLDEEARAGALQVFAGCELDPVARLRAAQILRAGLTPDEIPAELARVVAETMSLAWARPLADWRDPVVRQAAARTLLLEKERPSEAWPDADPERLFEHRLREGAADAAFEWAVKRSQLPRLLAVVRAVEGETAAVARVRGWVERRPDVLGALLSELARLGDAGQAELARLAASSVVPLELRLRALELGEGRASAEMRDDLRRLLDGAHADLRERSALGLLRIGDADDRRLVLEKFLAGAFREAFALAPAHEDVAFLEAAARSARGESRLRLARLVGRLADPARVPLLLALWRTADGELQAETRDILRRLDPIDVLPFIAEALAAGDTSILDVVGATRLIARPLIDGYARAADGPPWERFLERMAAGGTLTAPGLAGVLAGKLARPPHDRRAVRIFARLDDWSDPARVDELAAVIAPALAGGDRDELLQWIVESTTDLDVAQRVRVLAAVGGPGDRAVVLALADLLLAEPSQREALAAPLVAAIERAMDEELDGEPERARRVLGYRAARARTEVERSAAVDALEAGLAHRSPRVRLHAFRLLRAHADRARYLSATRRLLSDDDPAAVRSAIRALAYGRHLDAVGEIAELLFHASNTVRAAATDGLLFLGEEAIPRLTRLLARLRPDRRRTLAEVVERLRRRDEADEADDEPEPADSI